jgi:DNA helicase II / ATP-dependent DNA helicase PcrA
MAKGLEFDQVIIPDADSKNYQSDVDRGLLYIACTRAMHKLDIFYLEQLIEFIAN